MSKGVEEIGEMVRDDVERFVFAELLHHYSLTMEEGKRIANFAKKVYCEGRGVVNDAKGLNDRVDATRARVSDSGGMVSGKLFRKDTPDDSGDK